MKWITSYRQPGEKLSYEITGEVFRGMTKYHEVLIAETRSFGRALFLDHSPQSSSVDEFIYHEAICHPALVATKNPKQILVVGGGEGAVLREVLRHDGLHRVTMVDIDEELIDIAKQHLPEWSCGAFDDPLVLLRFEDARLFLENSDQQYDTAIIDVTAPKQGGPSTRLFTREFYKLLSDRLTAFGTVCIQAQSANINNLTALLAIHSTVCDVFAYVRPFVVHIPFYGDLWCFLLASNMQDPKALKTHEIDKLLCKRCIQPLRFFDGVQHHASMSLPYFLADTLKRRTPVSTDSNPFSYASIE